MKKKLYFFLSGFILFLGLHAIAFFVDHKPESSIQLQPASFSSLPGWSSSKPIESFNVLLKSCKVFLKMSPDQFVGNDYISLYAKDWFDICKSAVTLKKHSAISLRSFFENNFDIVQYVDKKPIQGLFTGYYFPSFEGSLVKTKTYSVPIYALPKDRLTIRLRDFEPQLPDRVLIGRRKNGQIIPYYTRAEIVQGALSKKAEVLLWVKSPIDRLFIEIQGSGTIILPDGTEVVLGYAGGNGAPYTAIGKVLIEKGVMTKENASMQGIRAYLESHPHEMDAIINQNQSFVFFRVLPQKGALGAQGVLLTPGYSLAVDKHYVPLGVPVWLKTTRPDASLNSQKMHRLLRLMIAQDTGGAIRGAVRGDVYWGAGSRATEIAGRMKNQGQYWILVPKTSP